MGWCRSIFEDVKELAFSSWRIRSSEMSALEFNQRVGNWPTFQTITIATTKAKPGFFFVFVFVFLPSFTEFLDAGVTSAGADADAADRPRRPPTVSGLSTSSFQSWFAFYFILFYLFFSDLSWLLMI